MPYPNEHSCRLESPDKYDEFRREDCGQKHEGKCIDVIFGIKTKPERKSEIQALRYPIKTWTEGDARNHCKTRNGSFEPAKKKEEGTMAAEKITKEDLKMGYPDLITVIEQDAFNRGQAEGLTKGKEEGLTAGAESERNRIKEIETQFIPGHEKLVEALKWDGKTTGPEAAMKILAAEKAIKSDVLNAIRADRIQPVVQPAIPVGDVGIDPNLPLDQRARAVWEKSPEIRAEFLDNFNSYFAYLKNMEAGNIRILKKEKGGNK